MQTIKILLSNTKPIWLKEINAIIHNQTDMDIVGEACTAGQTLALLRERIPDILLMDLNMLSSNQEEILNYIAKTHLDTKIIYLSSINETSNESKTFSTGECYHFDEPPENLFWMIRSAYWGEIWPASKHLVKTKI